MLRWIFARRRSFRSSALRSSAPRSRARGAVMVEYAMLLVAVGVPAVAGLSAGGLSMYNQYVKARNSMLFPMP